MLDDIKEQLAILVSLSGAIFAALMGATARHGNHPEGFRWKNFLWDVPFVFICALIAGGVGEYIHLPRVVIWALSGAFGYLGGQFLGPLLQRFFRSRADEAHDANPEKDA